MDKLCDLHVHSHFSDGTCSPAELIVLAKRAELSAIALCDHNTISGVPSFLEAAEGSGVEAVPGIEFSTEYQGVELHILGLYIRPEHYASIQTRLVDLNRRKEQSNRDLVCRLQQAGYAIDYDTIQASNASGFVNRAVVGAELTRLGYTQSVQDAFKKLLSPKHGYYVPPTRPDAYETIGFIKQLGAVAVLAHPFLNLEEGELRAFLPQAVEMGLDGMEVLYPKYDEATTQLAGQMAREFGILPSGGSDFHGENKPDIAMGVGRGNLRIPLSYLENLKKSL